MAGMPRATRQVFAYSGVLYPEPGGPDSFGLIGYALSLAGRGPGMRVCYVPTAVGDAAAAIEACTARFARHPAQIEFSALRLFTQPSVPDVRAHLLAQDVILVEGGSVVNLMAVWRAHGLPLVLRECWERGVYVGTELREAVSVLDGKRAWRVQPAGGGRYAEEAITPRLI